MRRRTTFARDGSGVEEYPLQLMIIVIVLGVSLPIIFSSFDYFQRENDRRLLENEVLRIENAIVQVYNQGLGSTLYFEVDVPDNTEFLKIGGPLSDQHSRYLIRYKVYNMQEEFENINDGRKGIPTTDANYGTLHLIGGHYTIRMEKKITSEDLNNDGHGGDFYVEIQKVYNV